MKMIKKYVAIVQTFASDLVLPTFLCFMVTVILAGCGQRSPAGRGSDHWEPQGVFDAREIMTTNSVVLFSEGRVTRLFSDRHPEWLGQYENSNGAWIWHVFANNWRIEPDGDSLLFIELGDPKNPLLRNPTNRFHLTPLNSIPSYYRTK